MARRIARKCLDGLSKGVERRALRVGISDLTVAQTRSSPARRTGGHGQLGRVCLAAASRKDRAEAPRCRVRIDVPDVLPELDVMLAHRVYYVAREESADPFAPFLGRWLAMPPMPEFRRSCV